MRKIIKNAIRCKNCGEVIESKHRHDYVQCKCGNCAVDGGLCYLRRCFNPSGKGFEDLSETTEVSEENSNQCRNQGGSNEKHN